MKTRTQPSLEVWEWQAVAACRGRDSSVFFPPSGERGRARRQREEAARAVCRACPVITHCRLFAAASNQRYGVWEGSAKPNAGRRGPRPTALDEQEMLFTGIYGWTPMGN
ncbi:WhiB family transcriptional regulator [Streptomyces sp. NPDC047079]|uniref:WhiB family transcriptional regulator n=1 Tax=Streptomyces sp. NPDC047079 TaxID=3154607 RepID=UPI0033C051B7